MAVNQSLFNFIENYPENYYIFQIFILRYLPNTKHSKTHTYSVRKTKNTSNN